MIVMLDCLKFFVVFDLSKNGPAPIASFDSDMTDRFILAEDSIEYHRQEHDDLFLNSMVQ